MDDRTVGGVTFADFREEEGVRCEEKGWPACLGEEEEEEEEPRPLALFCGLPLVLEEDNVGGVDKEEVEWTNEVRTPVKLCRRRRGCWKKASRSFLSVSPIRLFLLLLYVPSKRRSLLFLPLFPCVSLRCSCFKTRIARGG